MEVYVGQQPEGPYKVSNSSSDIVKRLCNIIKGTGRNVTMDNWFTAIPLVKSLVKDYKLTVIGTVRKIKRELPLEFSHPKHPPGGSMFAFRPCSLLKKKKTKMFYLCHPYTTMSDDVIDIKFLESQKSLWTIIIRRAA
jgi:hypothetical protein